MQSLLPLQLSTNVLPQHEPAETHTQTHTHLYSPDSCQQHLELAHMNKRVKRLLSAVVSLLLLPAVCPVCSHTVVGVRHTHTGRERV